MRIYEKFATDAQAEIEGVWVDLGGGASVKVARFGNPKHTELVKQLQKPYAQSIKAGVDIADDLKTAMAVESMAQAILLDWKGIEDEDGKLIPHSIENAKKLLGDLKDFRDTIAFLATQQETFRKAALEQAAKN